MKKALIILSICFSVIIFNTNVYAENRATTISTQIEPMYEVIIPYDTTVEFNATKTVLGSIELTKAQLEPNHIVTVSLETSGLLKHSANGVDAIAYTLGDENGNSYTSAEYKAEGEERELWININRQSWDRATAGNYSDTVIFTISYTAAH